MSNPSKLQQATAFIHSKSEAVQPKGAKANKPETSGNAVKFTGKEKSQTMEAITYTDVNGYKIPDLALLDDGLGEETHIGILGHRRLDYLKKHKRLLRIC